MIDLPPDTLNEIGVLRRREIEARLLAPLVQALGDEFGRERVLAVLRQTILQIARQQGAELAQAMGGCTLAHLAGSLANWRKGDAMDIRVLAQDETRFEFNVTRCGYAEMYRRLGIPELGEVLSCSRDAALIEGFNPRARLQRTQTILQGAEHCDFRYTLPAEEVPC